MANYEVYEGTVLNSTEEYLENSTIGVFENLKDAEEFAAKEAAKFNMQKDSYSNVWYNVGDKNKFGHRIGIAII